MRKFEFEVQEHEEYGGLGFKPKWFPGADPLSGMAVAHDILEHGRNEDGSTEHELMAFGAAMFIRTDGYYWYRKNSKNADESDHISADFPQLLRLHEENFNGREILHCQNGAGGEELWLRATRCVEKGLANCSEYGGDGHRYITYVDEEEMARWMCAGYKKAARRARRLNLDAYTMGCLFEQIERDADLNLKSAEEGMIYTVSLEISKPDFTSTLLYKWEDRWKE